MSALSIHSLSAVVQAPVGDWDGVLDVIDAVITLDEAWAPYCQVSLTVAPPPAVKYVSWSDVIAAYATWADVAAAYSSWTELISDWSIAQTLTDPLDPRDEVRVTITVVQEWLKPVRAPQSRDFDLLLRERVIDHRTGHVTLTFESAEGYLIDRALVASSPDATRVALASSLRSVINDVLLEFDAGLEVGETDFDFSDTPDALIQEPGTTYWDFLAPLVQTAGFRLFCDEEQRWWLVDSASYAIDDQINIATGYNLTNGEDSISRYRDWYDSVVVKYTWNDEDGTTHIAYDSAGGPGTKTLKLEWERPYPGSGAAAAILARATGRGRNFDIEALSDYTVTPGMALVATLPNTPIQTGVVSRVVWRFSAEGNGDLMTVGSRGLIDTPPTSWLFSPEGQSWDEIAEDIDWTEYTP